MIATGDQAPDFTAPLANGDIESFTLSERVDEAPIVLAFFPGAFTRVCTNEMSTFQDRLDEFTEVGASVYGVSIDTPFALNEFRAQNGLDFGLLSDSDRSIVEAWGIAMDFAELGVPDVAKRSVFVIDDDRTVTYGWVSDDPGVEPTYDEIIEAVEAV